MPEVLKPQSIVISHVADGGMAFGLDDDGVAVYVPKSVAVSSKVEEFQNYRAVLVPNRFHPEKTPLMAIRVYPHAAREGDLDAVTRPPHTLTHYALERLLSRVYAGKTTEADGDTLRSIFYD